MDSVNNLSTNKSSVMPNKISANNLLSLLNHHATDIKILSLDCFDTLLWRKTASPKDVFYDLQHSPSFQSHDLTAMLREKAEISARKHKSLRQSSSEVKLVDIYKAHNPALTEIELKALATEEIAAEIDACYAFPPMIELIRAAHHRGIKVIIVSNTYLSENELQYLLESTLPSDILPLIDRIFCSCDYGKSKIDGLFSHVLKTLSLPPHSILHIGDNGLADYTAPQTLGIKAAHFIPFNDDVAQMDRMQMIAASYLDTSIRHSRSLPNLFKGLLAANKQDNVTPEKQIGYTVAGPILYAFSRYINDEIKKLNENGKPPKVVFLMRDGYLPSLICETLMEKAVGKRVFISRFSAFAASFITEQDIDFYLADRIQSSQFKEIAKQLLLPDDIVTRLMNQIAKSSNPTAAFIQFIYQKDTLKTIFNASQQYRTRLIAHLKNEVGLENGDTLLFVDLGYTGTAQNKLQSVFKNEMDVTILGCYFLALRTPNWKASRSGLLDPSYYDDKTLSMIVNYIAILEQICTSPDTNSVIDYHENGTPIYSNVTLQTQQNQKIKSIQSECLRFARDAEQFFKDTSTALTSAILRDAAAIHLCRLIYLPTQSELTLFQDFQFDFNLGTTEIIPMFDVKKGVTALKRRGWLHSARENLSNMRINYPAEWRATNLELALTLMSQHRFGLEITLNDLSHRRENIQISLIQDNEITPLLLSAAPTHDGYFSLMVPIVSQACRLAIQFGLKYKWLELESADLIPLVFLYTNKEFENTQDMSANLMVDQMQDMGGGLFECSTDTSLLLFNPPPKLNHAKQVLRIVFRPIVMRE